MYRWYALNAAAGKEKKAQRELLRRVRSTGIESRVRRVVIPTETVTEVRDNERREREVTRMPGYLLAEMHLDADTWEAVKRTPEIFGFVGVRGDHDEPTPLTQFEVDRMLQTETTRHTRASAPAFALGQQIKIIAGPMADFSGEVAEIDDAGRKLRILVSIFGRETPVEVAYEQVRA